MFAKALPTPRNNRGPLRVMFLITSMPVGGAETLLVNLIRRLDRSRFTPELGCLKELGPLGEELAAEIPVHDHLLAHKYDVLVLGRLSKLMRDRQIDAVVTVGAGDKMFWGRLAAWKSNVPVILAALHSTGWPDGVGRLNRMLTPLTDAFIAVAEEHGRFLVDFERFPKRKVAVISNGIDTDRFQFNSSARSDIRRELGIDAQAPVCGIVAALRPEKNHELFLAAAAKVRDQLPDARFLIVGDGETRAKLESICESHNLNHHVHFVGSRPDIPELLSTMDLFGLTSHNEANPVSILEAMSIGLPVVSTRVGSIAESVADGETGYLTDPGDADQIAAYWTELLSDPEKRNQFGQAGREEATENWSLTSMVNGYESLIERIYDSKLPETSAISHHVVASDHSRRNSV